MSNRGRFQWWTGHVWCIWVLRTVLCLVLWHIVVHPFFRSGLGHARVESTADIFLGHG